MPKKSHYIYFLFLNLLAACAHLQGQDDSASTPSTTTTSATDSKPDKDKEDTHQEGKDKKKEEPPKIGNFSLPTSQQPYGLFALGGNVIDQGEIQLFFFVDEFEGKNKAIVELIPGILFGITNDCSLFFNFPVAPEIKEGCQKSAGLEDFFAQVEYAFYNKSTAIYADQATILGNISFPTGSIRKNPPTGFGSPTFFIGGTYTRTMVDWFLFTAHGAIVTTPNHRVKIGDQILYQFGFGRNIPSPPKWIYAWMIEVDGQYNKRNRFHGCLDRNSGGNIVFVTPSLWISSKEMLLQFGVSIPVAQNLFGKQNRIDYALNFNFAWSFYQ